MQSPNRSVLFLIAHVGALAACGVGGGISKEDVDTSTSAVKPDDNCKPHADEDGSIKNQHPFHNSNGVHATYSTRDGAFLDTNNPFFKDLGTNGRTCATCHAVGDGLSVSTASIQRRFERSCGTDPIFRTNDGSNSPNADVSTLSARRAAYSLLLNKGVIRIQRKIPANAQFELIAVENDPYGNDVSDGLSLFRRPLPSTNLKFVDVIMWDVREPNLIEQARNATLGHAQGASPSPEDLQSIVDFETSLFTSQVVSSAGSTSSDGALGDPVTLSTEPFFLNMNRDMTQVLKTPNTAPCTGGFNCSTAVLDFNVFTLYNAWRTSTEDNKQAVVRGQDLFNGRVFTNPGFGLSTCSSCHQTANTGSMSLKTTSGNPFSVRPFGGFVNVRAHEPQFAPDLPVYVLRNKLNNATIRTTDPGIAMSTGLIRDMNRFKTPPLRGLSARAPYFHNGMAPTLRAVVDHYNNIFSMNLTESESSDLTAFLGSL